MIGIYECKKQGDFELYNLTIDVSETNNVAKNKPKIVKKLKQLLLNLSTAFYLFTFD
ncbi:hypothetical protein JCM19300_1899 [Algibacter lectus]|uniref:Uncharacterized protein n=1 Tax=Algibacter lectus TaxID=221126 RepID=A0A090WYF9_9FLAO|nr:hypothetical protein JCM19300_1899 [Algibacter lectus]GAL81976.1 hypothetical protein JCM19274_156 [Algibacter lectus]